MHLLQLMSLIKKQMFTFTVAKNEQRHFVQVSSQKLPLPKKKYRFLDAMNAQRCL